eukprot:jgi/Picre1/32759/NNA_008104.t1
MRGEYLTWCVICCFVCGLGRELALGQGADGGTGPCPQNGTLEEIHEQRLEKLNTYVNAAGAIGPYRNWTLQETTMEGYLAPQANISVQGVGVFVGRQESIEYAALTNPTLNGNRLALLSREIINTTWVECNKLQLYSIDTWQVNKTDQETGKTWQVQLVQAIDQEFLTYVNCSDTIIDDHSVIDDAVNNAINTYVLSAKDSTFCVQNQCINQEYGPLPAEYFGEELIVCGTGLVTEQVNIGRQLKAKTEAYDQEAATAVQRLTDTDVVDPISLNLNDFGFQTSDGVTLLHSITMQASGSDLVAVMGPSGAGKTTLLKCLCGRQTSGKQRGTLSMSGGSENLADVAFVEQNPAGMVMSKPELIVVESLANQATFLFKAGMNKDMNKDKSQCVRQNVERVIELMGINEFQNTKLKHLSGGQQKRYRIAMELLSNPSGMLLDEPTSGLDSESALMLCTSLKSLASKGMLIIMNIHQPQDLILDLCSSVLLLKKGGYQALYDSINSLRERISSAQDIYNHFHFCPEEGREKGWISSESFTPLISSFALYDVSLKGRMQLEKTTYQTTMKEIQKRDYRLQMLHRFCNRAQSP